MQGVKHPTCYNAWFLNTEADLSFASDYYKLPFFIRFIPPLSKSGTSIQSPSVLSEPSPFIALLRSWQI